MPVGTDILEIRRIEKCLLNPRFVQRVFSLEEQAFLAQRNFNSATVTGSFCAKEAFAKAVGTGFRGFSFREISVLRDEKGAPFIRLEGNARTLFGEKLNSAAVSVSISHCREYATAVVLIL